METILLALRTSIGVSVAALVWVVFLNFAPPPDGESLATLLNALLPGLAGGAICAWLSPGQRFSLAIAAGGFLTLVLLSLMRAYELERDGQSLLLWYWPVWLTPAFCLGAALVQRRPR